LRSLAGTRRSGQPRTHLAVIVKVAGNAVDDVEVCAAGGDPDFPLAVLSVRTVQTCVVAG